MLPCRTALARGVLAVVAAGVLGAAPAGAAAAGEPGAAALKQTLFPRIDLASGDLHVRDEENRPLHLVAFAWQRWAPGGPGTFVALAVAATARGAAPGRGCGVVRTPVPGGVLVAVVRRERQRLRIVAHDSRPLTLGCDADATIAALTLERAPLPLSPHERGLLLRQRDALPGGRGRESLVLYRLVGDDLRVVLETERLLSPQQRALQVALVPARTGVKGFVDLVARLPGEPLAHAPARFFAARRAARPASQPAPGGGPAVYRWNGRRYVAR